MEGAVEKYSDSLFIIYGKDMLIRMFRYCAYKKFKLCVSYGSELLTKDGYVNVLVNPCMSKLPEIVDSVIVAGSSVLLWV